MRTNRLTSKTTPPQRRFASAASLEAQDAAFKSANQNYEAQMDVYKNHPKESKSYSQFAGGAVDVSKAGLAEYNRKRSSSTPEVTRIERPRAGGSEADFLKKATSGTSQGKFIGHVTYKEPTKPNIPKADWSNVELNAMPTKKASIASKKGKLRQSAPADKPVFNAPTSATKMGHKKAMGTKGAEYGDLKRAKAGVVKTTSAGLKREKAQFEAFAKSGGDQTKSMFKAEAKSSKAVGKQYKAEGNREGVQMMKQEAKQYKKASQFAGKLAKGTNKYYERNMVSKYNASR